MNNFAGKTVVVTGASAGIGRAIALRFGRAGAHVALIARDSDALSEVGREIERLGGRARAIAADVSDADAVFAAADEIVRQFGTIDLWINDAMVTVFAPVWKITPAEFRRVTEVTYLGVVHGTMAALRQMRRQGAGTIIQIGSALAYRGIPLQSAYCGAKHAIRGFTDSLRTELIHADSPIKLSVIELPAVNTPQFDWARTHMQMRPRPVPPVVQPEVIAEKVFHAAQRPSREYWIGWSTIKAIMANLIVPGVLDRYLARNTFDAQATAVPVSNDRRDNLLAPVTELYRTRGSFDAESGTRALAVSGPTARLACVTGAIALIFLAAFAGRRRLG